MTSTINSEAHLLAERSTLLVTLVGIAGYLAFDYVSFLESYRGLAITPWSPGAGLALALVMLLGWRASGVVLIAPPLAGALIRSETVPQPMHRLEGVTLGGS